MVIPNMLGKELLHSPINCPLVRQMFRGADRDWEVWGKDLPAAPRGTSRIVPTRETHRWIVIWPQSRRFLFPSLGMDEAAYFSKMLLSPDVHSPGPAEELSSSR